jgi:hypothetical protein
MLDRASAAALVLLLLSGVACGARTPLPDDGTWVPLSDGGHGGTGGSGGARAGAGGAGMGGAGQGGAGMSGAGQGGAGMAGSPPCIEGATQPCGSAVGVCKPGQETCVHGVFGPCEGASGPKTEVCNGKDDNCDGQIDDGFHIGDPCKGTGTDQCLDGVTTCEGCKKTGPDKVEICNGVDDNCNGVIDADCEVGDCKPTLLVTGSQPSSPGCIDFPVQAGSLGTIEYPCGGGPVTAKLGGISFVGTVSGGFVSLDADVIIPPGQSVDGCTWQNHHHIEGLLPSGTVDYSYSEAVIAENGNCWQPCTESGTVQINWVAP